MNKLQATDRLHQDGTAFDLILLVALWCLAIVLVNPAGNFPLNDDWSYGIAVKNLVQEKRYQPTPWTSMTLISQAAWGALFTSIFGFSFEVLRYSTLVLSLAAICCLHLLIRQLGQPRWVAVLGVLMLAFNPIYFSLSFTFMTDIPFIAFTVMALFFLLRHLTAGSASSLATGTAMTVIAILCRQTGLFIPLAFGLTLLLTKGFSWRKSIPAMTPFLFGAGSLLVYQYWLESSGSMPELYNSQAVRLLKVVQSPGLLLMTILKNTFVSILYLGFFLSPLLLASLFTETVPQRSKWLKRSLLPLSILLGAGLLLWGSLMPVGRNILHTGGVGLYGLYNEYLLKVPSLQPLPQALWIFVTLLAVLGGSLLIMHLLFALKFLGEALKKNRKNSFTAPTLFFMLGATIYILPFLLAPTFFDRYLLVALLLVLLGLLSSSTLSFFSSSSPRRRLTAALPLLFMVLFSIAATHDFMSWNRTRWQVLEQLTKSEKIPPHQIHGGFEFNGLVFFGDSSQSDKQGQHWWSEDPADYLYMLTFKEVPGYSVIQKYDCNRWLFPSQQNVLLLSRRDAYTSSTAGAE